MDVEEPAVDLPLSPPSKKRRSISGRPALLLGAGDGTLPRAARFAARHAGKRFHEIPRNLVCRVGGLVITRQRPGTAKGFVFLTLEDETGLVNVIVRPDVYESFRRTIRTSNTLVIEGSLQKDQGAIDLLAKRIWAFDADGLIDGVRPRNFH